MSYGNKEYQVKAIGQLVKSVSELLAKDASNKVCVFQSPTGSGKTVMVAKFIEEIIKELPEIDLCFLWVSIGKGDLHNTANTGGAKSVIGKSAIELGEEALRGTVTENNTLPKVISKQFDEKGKLKSIGMTVFSKKVILTGQQLSQLVQGLNLP